MSLWPWSRRHLPVEEELIPYLPGFPPGQRWLVLAPHPDDEVFGPGATIAQAAQHRVEVRIVVVTDGAVQGSAEVRESEAIAAAAELGCEPPVFLRFADRSLDPASAELQRRLREVVEQSGADVVFVPSPVDLHPDHRSVALALQRLLRRWTVLGLLRRGPRWLVTYEVGTPQQPNLLVDAGDAWAIKLRAAACYPSQLTEWPYERVATGLGCFRALTLRDAEHVEALRVFDSGWVARRSARRWAMHCGSPLAVGG